MGCAKQFVLGNFEGTGLLDSHNCFCLARLDVFGRTIGANLLIQIDGWTRTDDAQSFSIHSRLGSVVLGCHVRGPFQHIYIYVFIHICT